jgi:quinoprotein glucose dehydrogenase
MLRENDDRDPFLRHAGVVALSRIGDLGALVEASKDPRKAVRLAALVALRRLERKEVEIFLQDSDPAMILEAARAIHDVPIPAAFPALVRLLERPGLSDRVYVRAANAAFRQGDLGPLLPFVRNVAPPELRAWVLEGLAEWEHPPGRDRVLGHWRALPSRTLDETSRERLGSMLLAEITAEEDDRARVLAIRAWGALRLGKENNIVRDCFKDPRHSSAVRVEALRAMGEVKDPETTLAVKAGLEDQDPAVREEAVRLLVRLRLPDTAGLLERLAKEKGALGVRQAAVASLGDWEGREADAVAARLLDLWSDLPGGLHLELLEAAAKRSSAEVKDRLSRIEVSRVPTREMLEGGDPQAGREIFFDRLDVSCARCHAVKDKGGTVGPPLTLVGRDRTRDQILESILFPNREIVPGYGQTLLQMSDGAIEAGRIEKETDGEIQLILADGSRKTVAKSRVTARKAGLSAMPEDVSKALTKREIRDLVAYLSSLR